LATYSVVIPDEANTFLDELAEATNAKVEDLLQDLVGLALVDNRVELVISQYKKGSLKAREAWKFSGLNYQDFQTRASS
jgi:hypothetical protein